MIPSTPFTSFTTKPGFVSAKEPHFRFGLSYEVENFYAGYFLYETKGATMEWTLFSISFSCHVFIKLLKNADGSSEKLKITCVFLWIRLWCDITVFT